MEALAKKAPALDIDRVAEPNGFDAISMFDKDAIKEFISTLSTQVTYGGAPIAMLHPLLSVLKSPIRGSDHDFGIPSSSVNVSDSPVLKTQDTDEENKAPDFMEIDGTDLRDTDFLNPVRDQTNGRCCYAFCACLVVEYMFQKETGHSIVLSPQDLYENLISSVEMDRKGRSIQAPFHWMKEHGCMLEETHPYRGTWKGKSMAIRQPVFYLESYSTIPLEGMESHLRSIGPIVVGLVWINEMNYIRDEIYQGPANPNMWTNCANEPTGHTVVVIGFGSELINKQLVDFWLVQNSHGEGWGRNGYGRFSSSIRLPNGRLLIDGGVVPYDAEKLGVVPYDAEKLVKTKLPMHLWKIHDAEKADAEKADETPKVKIMREEAPPLPIATAASV